MWGMITGPMNLNDELSSTTPHEWKPFNLQNIIFLVISKTKKKKNTLHERNCFYRFGKKRSINTT